MRIYCDALEVFEGPEHRDLERLLMRVRLGQHELVFDDLDGFFVSDFFNRAVADASRVEVQELLERQHPALADRSLDPTERAFGPRAELVPIAVVERTCRRDGLHPVWEIDPSTVGSWSEAPLRVLLENDDDWQLVAASARVYQRSKVLAAKTNKFLQLDQRGGKGEIKNAVEACLPDERIFIVMDSDRTTVAGPEDREQQKIRALAETRPNIFPFILAKREVENYLPASIWQDAVDQRTQPFSRSSRYIDHAERVKNHRAWRELPESDKDIIDLEDYFSDAKAQVAKLADVRLVPDAPTLEARAGTAELRSLLDAMEAWL